MKVRTLSTDIPIINTINNDLELEKLIEQCLHENKISQNDVVNIWHDFGDRVEYNEQHNPMPYRHFEITVFARD